MVITINIAGDYFLLCSLQVVPQNVQPTVISILYLASYFQVMIAVNKARLPCTTSLSHNAELIKHTHAMGEIYQINV